MSRFEPASSVNYGKMHENINIVRRRSAAALFTNTHEHAVLVDLQFGSRGMASDVTASQLILVVTTVLPCERQQGPQS